MPRGKENGERRGRSRNAGSAMDYEPLIAMSSLIKLEKSLDVRPRRSGPVSSLDDVIKPQCENGRRDRIELGRRRLVHIEDRDDPRCGEQRSVPEFVQTTHVVNRKIC